MSAEPSPTVEPRDGGGGGAGRGEPAAVAVAVRGASVQLNGRTIWQGIDLTVAAGEFVAVLGPNGSGKSTLMKAVLGLLAPSAGELHVLGGSPRQARPRIGYLPQRRSFDASTRVRGIDIVRLGLDGTRFGLALALSPRARARRRRERERVAEVIERVGASRYADRPIGELSGGEQQRLLVAQALVQQPELLILDEPLDSLDLPSQTAVAGLLQRICREDRVAVLLVAHDVNPLLGYLDRVIYLAAGRALEGAVEEVVTSEQLSALFGVPIEVLRTGDGRLVVVGEPDAPHHHGHRHDHVP
jgi:zinc/manganese transport system ATP-binding protein